MSGAEYKARRARQEEREELWKLACRSKAAWGYDEQFMARCAQELFPRELDLAFVMVSQRGEVVGFCTLEQEEGTLELGHLFVEPEHWGRGIGRELLDHARRLARTRGFESIVIQGDPHARKFYERCGARLVGERPSGSIAGRSLPLFEISTLESP